MLSHVFLALGSLIMLYPFAFAFLGMFKSAEGFYEVNFIPVPENISFFLDNIVRLFRRNEIYPAIGLTLTRFVWYTLIVGGTSVLAGYAFAKVNFKGKNIAFYILMSSMMIPGVAMLIPQYQMLMRFPLVGGNDLFGKGGAGFRDSPLLLFITGWFSAYNIFLIRQTLVGLGNEYKEAAEIDGAGFFRIVFMIYLPMLKPVLAVIIIQTFIGQWNDYLFPQIFLSGSPEYMPIGVVSVRIQSDYINMQGLMNYPVAMVMAIVMMIPPVAVYIAFQKYFVEGLTAGGVKN